MTNYHHNEPKADITVSHRSNINNRILNSKNKYHFLYLTIIIIDNIILKTFIIKFISKIKNHSL